MRKKIFFGIFTIVLMVANFSQLFQDIQGNFTLHQLLNVAFAESENGGGTPCRTKIELNEVSLQGCYGSTNVFGYDTGTVTCIGTSGGGCYYGSWNLKFTCASEKSTGTDTRKWKDCPK